VQLLLNPKIHLEFGKRRWSSHLRAQSSESLPGTSIGSHESGVQSIRIHFSTHWEIRRLNKTWKAVYLENEYLKVTVLPELGGHVYQIFDKTLNRDIIYTNPVMKYAMVALRGAWVSGGIEWNFPDGHTLTTVASIDYVIRTEPDGSAALAVGDTERVQGMQWQVILRLRPGTRVLETEVTLNNRRPVTGRYWYWSTAGAPAAPIFASTIQCVKRIHTRFGRL
jgi:hypothetical protein